MKRTLIIICTFILFAQIATHQLFAQVVTPTPVNRSAVPNTSPTPVPEQPTGTPAPTAALTPMSVTPIPTAIMKIITPTSSPEAAPAKAQSTPIPTQAPTPTPQPVSIEKIKPPGGPVSQLITAPFNLMMSSLPQSYYNDQGLRPQTNALLLMLAFLCLVSGGGLLLWPRLVKVRDHVFTFRVKQRESFPYLAGRA